MYIHSDGQAVIIVIILWEMLKTHFNTIIPRINSVVCDIRQHIL